MTQQEKTFITHNNYKETQKLAQDFAKKLKGGEVLALYGELGAGKTTFIQGLAKGLGVKRRIISPTFIIVRTYKINIKNKISKSKNTAKISKLFYHIDLYRVEDKDALGGLGIKEILNDPNSIVAIEWAEKMRDLLPSNRIDIRLAYVSENERKITITRNNF